LKISNGAAMKAARLALGWSLRDMARALRLAQVETKGPDRVRDMESGARDISGPVTVAVEAFLTGFRPAGWRDE
jgi:transcriptional regulator with XRE-family HTH domain